MSKKILPGVEEQLDAFANLIYECINDNKQAKKLKIHRVSDPWYYREYDPLDPGDFRKRSPTFRPATPEGKYFKKALQRVRPHGQGIYLYNGQLLDKNTYEIKRAARKATKEFNQKNKDEIKRQKYLIKNFRNMFKDEGIEIIIPGTMTSFERRAKIVKIFEDNEMIDLIENYALLHELKKDS